MTDTTSRRRLRRAGTIVIAFVSTLVIWALCTLLVGVDLIVDQGGPQPVRLLSVAGAPIISGLAGWGLLALLERLLDTRGRAVWRVIAIAVGVLSLISPVMAGLTAATIGWLLAFHVVVGAILIIGFSLPPSPDSRSKINSSMINVSARSSAR